MNDYAGYIAFIKYEGSSVEEGFMDARKSAEALLGFDEGLRHYLLKAGVEEDFEIPVRIRKGSWEALIPETLLGWALASGGIVATAYLSSAASQIAKNDFENVSLGGLIQNATSRLQNVVRIGKHVEGQSVEELNTSFKDDGYTIVIHGKSGDMETTKDQLEDYASFPKKALSRMVGLVQPDRKFKLGLVKDSKVYEEEVTQTEKGYFYTEGDIVLELFPELKDGMEVVLEGKLVRANQHTNALGLEYRGYTLTCKPKQGTVELYKPYLFTKCRVHALVDRESAKKKGYKKPFLLIGNVEELEVTPDINSMFE